MNGGDRKRLGDGMVVEASVLARVLGIKLLTLDARVMLLPADQAPKRLAPAPRTGGRGLGDAVRSLNEGAAILEETRRNGSS